MLNSRNYVILRGGLGNQMHQIAAAIRFSQTNGGLLIVYSDIVDNALNKTRRGFWRELDFEKAFNFASVKETNFIEKFFLKLILKFQIRVKIIQFINDVNFGLASTSRIRIIQGWFQSDSYIPENHQLNLLLKEKINSEKILKYPDSIIVHIRLTDFKQYFPEQLSRNYYLKAINLAVNQELEKSKICFSDDLIEALEFLPETTGFIFPEKNDRILDPIELLISMSSSRFLISSKSTLSWWAGMITLENGGKVVSPVQLSNLRENWIFLED